MASYCGFSPLFATFEFRGSHRSAQMKHRCEERKRGSTGSRSNCSQIFKNEDNRFYLCFICADLWLNSSCHPNTDSKKGGIPISHIFEKAKVTT